MLGTTDLEITNKMNIMCISEKGNLFFSFFTQGHCGKIEVLCENSDGIKKKPVKV